MPNHNLFKNACLEKNPFSSSVENNIADKPCLINEDNYNNSHYL